MSTDEQLAQAIAAEYAAIKAEVQEARDKEQREAQWAARFVPKTAVDRLLVEAGDAVEAVETAVAEATNRRPFDSKLQPVKGQEQTWTAKTGKFSCLAWIESASFGRFLVVVEVTK